MYLTTTERAAFEQAHQAVSRALRQIDQAEGPAFINASYDFVKPRFVPPKRQPQSERRTNGSENTYRRSA